MKGEVVNNYHEGGCDFDVLQPPVYIVCGKARGRLGARSVLAGEALVLCQFSRWFASRFTTSSLSPSAKRARSTRSDVAECQGLLRPLNRSQLVRF